MHKERNVDIQDLFHSKQKELLARFELVRCHSTHMGVMGDASESVWIGILRNFLPHRYQVEKAIVVDSEGRCSDQIDIVIFDRQYSPLVIRQDELVYVPAESVYAVIECKQSINKDNIVYASDKFLSVRCLKRTSVSIHSMGKELPARNLFEIVGGFLSLTSDWKKDLGDSLKRSIGEVHEDEAKRLDIGCVLDVAAFDVRYLDSEGVSLHLSDSDSSLMHFLFGLFARLRTLGTVPAVDLDKYSRHF